MESEHHYTEAWVEPVGIRALWVKEWAPEATKKAAKILAKHRKVPLLILGKNSRIWDVCSSTMKKISFGG